MRDLFDQPVGDFQPISTVCGSIMAASQQSAKLRMIARLDSGEIKGWMQARKFDKRPWFPGEMEALCDRAKTLGVRL